MAKPIRGNDISEDVFCGMRISRRWHTEMYISLRITYLGFRFVINKK